MQKPFLPLSYPSSPYVFVPRNQRREKSPRTHSTVPRMPLYIVSLLAVFPAKHKPE